MKVFLTAFFFIFIVTTCVAQVDGYLTEYGTNGSELIKKNGIKKEIVCNYSFSTVLKGITIFSDISKVLLVDSVTIFFDDNGNMTKRERFTKKRPSKLVDFFFYDSSNSLIRIESNYLIGESQITIGYTDYTYNFSGDLASSTTKYKLPNGIIKNSEVRRIYNDKKQLIEVWEKTNISKSILTEKYFYDRKGRVKRIESYNSDYAIKYKYRRRKTIVLSNNVYEDYHKTIMNYNSLHQCVKMTHGDSMTEFTYNRDGTLAESKRHYDEDRLSISQHQYIKE